MRNKLKFILLASISALSFLSLAVGTIAWFGNSFTFADINDKIKGDSAAAYFAYGDGSYEHPFGINTARHLYNLAWLQYNGNFNQVDEGETDEDPDTIHQQYYFEIDPEITEINMNGWVLPPIGTEEYPFVGSFNGNGKTIKSLTVSNKTDLTKPNAIEYDEQPEIVGLFGVVGKIDTLPYEYDPDINEVKNFTLQSVTVESKTQKTLVGLAAGFNGGDMDGIKVSGTATIDVNGQKSRAIGGQFTKLSNYGLIGYTKVMGTSSGDYSQEVSEYYDNGARPGGGGSDVGEGGSFKTRDYADWFIKLHYYHEYDTNNGILTASSNNTKKSTVNGVEQYNISFTCSDAPKLGYYDENVYVNIYHNGTARLSSFLIYRDNNGTKNGELVVGDTTYPFRWAVNSSGTRNSNDPENFAITFTGTKPKINGKTLSGSTIYLNHLSSSSGANYRIYSAAGGTGKNNMIGPYQSMADITSAGTSSLSYMQYNDNRTYKRLDQYTETQLRNLYRLRDGNYIPLKFTDDNRTTTSDKNTGYIVGSNIGSTNASPKLGTTSNYTMAAATNSMDGSAYNASKFVPLTYTKYNGSWGWYSIGDTRNNNTQNSKINNSDFPMVSAKNLKLQKYEYYEGLDNAPSDHKLSRDALHDTFSGKQYLYGIHFDSNMVEMNPTNSSGFLTIPKAKISAWDNKATTTVNEGIVDNLKVPKGSIDFHFGSTGYINFFAGAYVNASGSWIDNNFFSLYSIKRNSSTKTIENIYEILEVYDNTKDENYTIADGALDDRPGVNPSETNQKYAYKALDKNGNTVYLPSGFGTKVNNKANRLVFDVDAALRLKNETDNAAPLKQAIYYFEIPVDVGEYCMGNVSNGDSDSSKIQGAYLLYLDIAANANKDNRDNVTAYSITTISSSSRFPAGVDFAITGATGTGGSSIAVEIESEKQGIVSFVINNANIEIGGTTEVVDEQTYSICSYTYKNGGFGNTYTVSGNSPNDVTLSAGDKTRETFIRVEDASSNIHRINITDILDSDDEIKRSSCLVDGQTFDIDDISTTFTTITTETLNLIRNRSTAVTFTRDNEYNSVDTFDVTLPELAWEDSTTYITTILFVNNMHIRVVKNITTITLYVNGTLISSNDTTINS